MWPKDQAIAKPQRPKSQPKGQATAKPQRPKSQPKGQASAWGRMSLDLGIFGLILAMIGPEKSLPIAKPTKGLIKTSLYPECGSLSPDARTIFFLWSSEFCNLESHAFSSYGAIMRTTWAYDDVNIRQCGREMTSLIVTVGPRVEFLWSK
ncbi:hypothetical protein AMTR_s00010p00261650 [Amborella trichopoda]|uniref:Uncharacterized protein n=1 Tax=Amborella trichopoda TaxID=13333 RepID=W1NH34_AMBTC|nr:hypothetical protein AMTR_s00010p00261650 [Amborella trichopoda]